MNTLIAVTNSLVCYSNVLMAFLMPKVGEFAQKAHLPEGACSAADVREYALLSDESPEVVLTFKSGNIYRFLFGYVQSFESPHAYYDLQDPTHIPMFYGALNMTKAEAVELARTTIKKLGYSEEDLYADLEPQVVQPSPIGTNIIPHFLITWPAPNRDTTSARFEINGGNRSIESIWLLNFKLFRDPPMLPGFKGGKCKEVASLSDKKEKELVAAALPKIADYIKRINLTAATPTNANAVAMCNLYTNDNVVSGMIRLKDGFVFTISKNEVSGFDASDIFFVEDHEVEVKRFVGKWNISETAALALARQTITKLGLPKRSCAGVPEIVRPFGAAKNLVPRCKLCWQAKEQGLPDIQVEVDGDSGTIKSLRIWPSM